MRAAAVALVLIVGAAVVLWFGNMANSLVLGGLIGGLAALLLSIPISLTLFSYLSRRHDERLRAEAAEEMALQEEELAHYPETAAEIYEADALMLPPAEEKWNEVGRYYPDAGERNLPVPVQPHPRLSAARQKQLPTSEHLSPRHRTTEYPLAPERQPRNTPGGDGRSAAPVPRRPRQAQPAHYPGFPGYQPNTRRSAYQTAALRAARQEAALRAADNDTEVVPTNPSRRLPAVRPDSRIVTERTAQPFGSRPSRQLPPHQQSPSQYQPRPTVEGSSETPRSGRALPKAGESAASQASQGRQPRMREMQTDKIGGMRPQTGPIPRQATEPIGRNPQINEQRRNPDTASGSLKNPLQRRAPYMYEDDPLRQELAQHLEETPQVRRSSRYLNYKEDED